MLGGEKCGGGGRRRMGGELGRLACASLGDSLVVLGRYPAVHTSLPLRSSSVWGVRPTKKARRKFSYVLAQRKFSPDFF